MIVAYQGVEGAFSHEASLYALPDHEPQPFPTFALVAEAVRDGLVDAGVIPMRNSSAGEVPGSRDLVARTGVRIEREVARPIRMHLLALPGTRLEDVQKVISHPVALLQCKNRLAELGIAQEEALNTAVAAQGLKDHQTAALASLVAAELYGLEALLMDVQDDLDNRTTFAVLRRG